MNIGKHLIIAGIVLTIVGAFFLFGDKFGIGKLPGDIVVKRDNFSFSFPIVTCLLVSVVLTLVMRFFNRS